MKFQTLAATSTLLAALLVPQAVQAQVNGPGPSPSSQFDIVINLPADIIEARFPVVGGVEGQTTQVNISEGAMGIAFTSRFGSEVNITGGDIAVFQAESGSEVNISGRNGGIVFFAEADSKVNISGGPLSSLLKPNPAAMSS